MKSRIPMVAILLAVACGGSEPPTGPSQPAASALKPGAIDGRAALATSARDVAFDVRRKRIYISQPATSSIAVYDVASKALVAPLTLGSAPAGIDITPDGDTLVVAMPTENRLLLIPLIGTAAPFPIPLPVRNADEIPQFPDNIRILRNRHVFVTMAPAGFGYGGRMLEVDLDTRVVGPRPDVGANGRLTEDSPLTRSANGEWLMVLESRACCPVTVHTYSVASSKFDGGRNTSGSESAAIAIDSTGRYMLIGGARYDNRITPIDSVRNVDRSIGTLSMDGQMAWFHVSDGIEARRFGITPLEYYIQLADPVKAIYPSPDGTRIAVATTRELIVIWVKAP